jgi:hypothetical protein
MHIADVTVTTSHSDTVLNEKWFSDVVALELHSVGVDYADHGVVLHCRPRVYVSLHLDAREQHSRWHLCCE